jgi:hypothetical protein
MRPRRCFAAEFSGWVIAMQHYRHGATLSWPTRLSCGSISGLMREARFLLLLVFDSGRSRAKSTHRQLRKNARMTERVKFP